MKQMFTLILGFVNRISNDRTLEMLEDGNDGFEREKNR